jgi:hypothetical protein
MELAIFDNLLKDYESLKAERENRDMELMKNVIDPFLHDYIKIRPVIRANERKITGNYNVFNILQIIFKEARFHTPFLCDLLNPKGEHRQGSEFLNLFFDEIFSPDVSEKLKSFSDNAWVISEAHSSFGFIDILIVNNTGHPYAIVLENKINSGDQLNQLERYHTYLVNYYPRHEKYMLYLNPILKDPSERSLTSELKSTLLNSKTLRVISYKDEILNWIRGCIEACESLEIKSILRQYVSTLNEIIHEKDR